MDVFISYCRVDHEWKERVSTFMQSMRRHGHFDYSTWDDGEIKISDDWKNQIFDSINQAKVAILLISPDFLASRFINDVEVPHILERKETNGLIVVPVIVRPSPWEIVPWLSSIQLHPANGDALSKGNEHEIENNLKELILEVHRLVQQPDQPATSDGDQSKSAAIARAEQKYAFIGDKGVRELVKARLNDDVIDTLLLYKIKTQNVWIATTSQYVVCIIDSQRTADSNRMIQWKQRIEPGIQVHARPKSRFSKAGTVDIGRKQNWLYNLRRYPDPEELKNRIETMLNRALRS